MSREHLAVIVLDAAALTAADTTLPETAAATTTTALVLAHTGTKESDSNEESGIRAPEKTEAVLAERSLAVSTLEPVAALDIGNTVPSVS